MKQMIFNLAPKSYLTKIMCDTWTLHSFECAWNVRYSHVLGFGAAFSQTHLSTKHAASILKHIHTRITITLPQIISKIATIIAWKTRNNLNPVSEWRQNFCHMKWTETKTFWAAVDYFIGRSYPFVMKHFEFGHGQ